jgi:hypothetical protein
VISSHPVKVIKLPVLPPFFIFRSPFFLPGTSEQADEGFEPLEVSLFDGTNGAESEIVIDRVHFANVNPRRVSNSLGRIVINIYPCGSIWKVLSRQLGRSYMSSICLDVVILIDATFGTSLVAICVYRANRRLA